MNIQQHEDVPYQSSDDPAFTGSAYGRRSYPEKEIRVIVLLPAVDASSAVPRCVWKDNFVFDPPWTAVNPLSLFDGEIVTGESSEGTRRAVSELRRLSGLTWDQLGQLFNVTRRSVHFWASGKPLNATNEQRLLQVLAVVRWADRGDARSNRSALLEVRDGDSPFALLKVGELEAAKAQLGPGPGRRGVMFGELNSAAKTDRMPLPPEELIDAMHDSVQHDVGRGRAARTVRNKLRGSVG